MALKFNFDYLKTAHNNEVKQVVQENQQLKSIYRGYTQGKLKSGSMRHVLRIPVKEMHGLCGDPDLAKYFDKNQDPHERKKHLIAFAKRYPQYLVVDHL